MATFALIHGGGSTAWDWHLVTPVLMDLGHDVVAVDLPIEDENAGLEEYVRTVTAAVGERQHIIVVGHSLGGFIAPLVCEKLRADGLVYLAAMIPWPGETFVDWWTNTGHDRERVNSDPDVSFFNGVPDDLAREARARGRDQQGEWMSRPWPAEGHPTVPTMAILCLDDQFFPASFMRRHVRDRLGIEPLEIPGGHYAALTEPDAVANKLDEFARSTASNRQGATQ
ncbi:alpha/beta hydrolase [Salinibacterium sp. ZJ454]|uniref:alpha/beta fold hydrolase n=1 Tax=Salinibacterium sp. ZJ454 TaxID=2708339 RepID=UPI00141EC072|nr:alpha/beta hydrolase [Salinibacterium sp. ZJ454]